MLVMGCLKRALTHLEASGGSRARRRSAADGDGVAGLEVGGCTSGLRHTVVGRATGRHQTAHLSFVALLAIAPVAGLGAVPGRALSKTPESSAALRIARIHEGINRA